MISSRQLRPELLDTLAPDDPRAMRSRRDLRRINRLMASASLLGAPLDRIVRDAAKLRIVELGAGDGELLLQLARRHARRWPKVTVELLDMQPVVSAQTLANYRELGWDVEVTRADVFDWLAQPTTGVRPVLIANLFVHHFEGQRLRVLLDGIARRANAFVCCEPRRSVLALTFSRLLVAIGCSAVTRHDALASVHAGFSAHELSSLWPQSAAWRLCEGPAGMFSHRFQAVRV
jgi:hypothetical protein